MILREDRYNQDNVPFVYSAPVYTLSTMLFQLTLG